MKKTGAGGIIKKKTDEESSRKRKEVMKKSRKENRKKWLLILSMLICSLSLSACAHYTEEELQLMEEYEKTGEENAIAYIEEKYDFTPTVLDVDCVTMGHEFDIDFTPPPTGDVFVKMQDDKSEEEFWVYATGKEPSLEDCYDNYQHEEIDTTIEEQLENLFGVEIQHLELAYGEIWNKSENVDGKISNFKEYGLVHNYFDGENLPEVLNDTYKSTIVACIVSEEYIPDLIDCSIGALTEQAIYEGAPTSDDQLMQIIGENTKCTIINYNNKEACDLAHEKNGNPHESYFFIKDEYCLIGNERTSNHRSEYASYEVKKFEDFYYIQKGGTYCNFEKVEDLLSASSWNGRGFKNAKKVYDEYAIDTDAFCLYVFVPTTSVGEVERLDWKVERHDIRLAVQSDFEKEEEWKTSYDTEIFSVTKADQESYLTARIYIGNYNKNHIFSVFVDQEE